MSIEFSKRKSVFSELKNYCHLSDDDDFIEVTEWSNGDGYDIVVSSTKRGDQFFSLTYGEIDLLQVLLKIQYGDQGE